MTEHLHLSFFAGTLESRFFTVKSTQYSSQEVKAICSTKFGDQKFGGMREHHATNVAIYSNIPKY
jgi:hypothetical protein